MYSDSEDEERSLSSDSVPRYSRVFNFTKKKTWSPDVPPVDNIMPNSTNDCSPAERKAISKTLKFNAKKIARISEQTGTAVLCVVLQKRADLDGENEPRSAPVWKMFVFTNMYEYDGEHGVKCEQTSLVKAAHDMGYHVVQAQQSHAEMGLLQFLEERRHIYEPVPIAMGCNRGTCYLCAELLDVLWDFGWEKWFGMERSSMFHIHWFTPRALIDMMMKDPEVTADFRERYKDRIPRYAKVWARGAPDFYGCTDVKGWHVWQCDDKDACWRHGARFEDGKIPENHPHYGRQVEGTPKKKPLLPLPPRRFSCPAMAPDFFQPQNQGPLKRRSAGIDQSANLNQDQFGERPRENFQEPTWQQQEPPKKKPLLPDPVPPRRSSYPAMAPDFHQPEFVENQGQMKRRSAGQSVSFDGNQFGERPRENFQQPTWHQQASSGFSGNSINQGYGMEDYDNGTSPGWQNQPNFQQPHFNDYQANQWEPAFKKPRFDPSKTSKKPRPLCGHSKPVKQASRRLKPNGRHSWPTYEWPQ